MLGSEAHFSLLQVKSHAAPSRCDRAPLRRTVETAEVADAAMFLLSEAGRAVTAEILMVDGGYHATGM